MIRLLKSPIKRLLGFLVVRIGYLRRRKEWGYASVPWRILLVNFIFQRIFRINSDTPWSVAFTSRVIAPESLRIGANVGRSFALSGCCYVQAINGVEIGDDTLFAFGVGIVSANHAPDDIYTNMKEAPVRIGRNCWLGKNAVVLPGVELGDRCIVAAGAVVTKSFEAGSVVAGVPARLISRNSVAA